jgi:hypothetical protein
VKGVRQSAIKKPTKSAVLPDTEGLMYGRVTIKLEKTTTRIKQASETISRKRWSTTVLNAWTAVPKSTYAFTIAMKIALTTS